MDGLKALSKLCGFVVDQNNIFDQSDPIFKRAKVTADKT